jgi:hypothetical protein
VSILNIIYLTLGICRNNRTSPTNEEERRTVDDGGRRRLNMSVPYGALMSSADSFQLYKHHRVLNRGHTIQNVHHSNNLLLGMPKERAAVSTQVGADSRSTKG